jgi:uncharacterized protein YciI
LKQPKVGLTLRHINWESPMLFAVINTDRPGQLDLRLANRPAHLEFLDANVSKLVHGGATLDAEGKPAGSLLIVEAENIADVQALTAADPYAKAGLFESSVVRPFREVYRDGRKL